MGSQNGKVWPKKGAKRGQEENMSPRGSEACPESPQDSPKSAPRGPKRAPRGPKESPNSAQRVPQERPKRDPREPLDNQESPNLALKPPVASAGSRSAYNITVMESCFELSYYDDTKTILI